MIPQELSDLGALGEQEDALWWHHILLLDGKTLAIAAPPVNPLEHLVNAKYLDVIERNSGAPERNARWCVWSERALAKCRALAKAAHSRDVRPRIDCLMEQNQDACLSALRNEGADIMVLDGGLVLNATRNFNVKAIIAENYGLGSTKMGENAAVAVIKKDSPIKKFADLTGKKSCHSQYGTYAGWIAPILAMKKAGVIQNEQQITDVFTASCAPDAPIESKLCSLCVGNVNSKDEKIIEATKCKASKDESFWGGKGALR